MTKKFLDGTQIPAARQQMGGKAMAQERGALWFLAGQVRRVEREFYLG